MPDDVYKWGGKGKMVPKSGSIKHGTKKKYKSGEDVARDFEKFRPGRALPVETPYRPTPPTRRSSGAKFLQLATTRGPRGGVKKVQGIGWRMSWDLTGFDRLAALADDLIFTDVMDEAAEIIREAAFNYCPKPPTPPNQRYQRTGTLSDAIKTRWTVRNNAAAVIEVGVADEDASNRSGKGYAIHVEYGTDYMHERPFLRPAMEENRIKVGRMIVDELKWLTQNAARAGGKVVRAK